MEGLWFTLGLLWSVQLLAGTDVSISGHLVGDSGVLLPAITVLLGDEFGQIIKTTQANPKTGSFDFFSVTSGEYQIFVQHLSFLPSVTRFQVGSAGVSGIEIRLHPQESIQEMVVQVRAKRKLMKTSSARSSSEMRSDQIQQLSQGMEVNLPKLLATTQPGIVQGPYGQTFVRGNHANIQYQIDGVQLPDSPSSTFGQALSPRIIDHMEVITGGIPAEYGQRLSAVVNVVTKSGSENSVGEVELNYGSYNSVTPHLLYGGSNASGSLHYFLSANYSRTDRGLDTPQPESYSNQFQGGKESIHNLAVGHHEFAKLDWMPNNVNKISFILFNSKNSFQIPNYPSSFKSNDPYFQPNYTDSFGNKKDDPGESTYIYRPVQTNDTQSEGNSYAQLIWKHTFHERSFLQLAPYFKHSTIVVTNDPQNDLFIANGQVSSFSQDRIIDSLGIKTDYSIRPTDQHLVKTGFQIQASRSAGPVSIQNSLLQPAVVDPTLNLGYLEGFYIQDDYTYIKPLVFNVGIRFDAAQFSFGKDNFSDYFFQPRLGLNYLVSEMTQLHIFYGKLFQPAPIEHLRYQFDPKSGALTSLQSYDIKAEKNDYFEIGIAQQVMDSQIAKLNVYYKTGVNILDDAQLLNTSIAQPYNFATGYAYGAELSVKGSLLQDWSQFISYSYGIAKGKGMSGGVGGDSSDIYQFLDHVQIHTANTGLTYAKNFFWWTGQALYGSGLRTGPLNSIGLPGHFTVDTTVGYQFHGKSWFSNFKLSGDLLNISDNRYPITIANGFNGSHYAAGRQFFIRVSKEL